MDTVTLILFLIGFPVLVVGAEFLVRGASGLATLLGVSPLVVGLTVVAYGTSTPELAVSIQSSLQDQSDIALGNIVGSNILNVLFILGLSAAIVPLVVQRRLIRFEVPVIVVASVLLWIMALDGRIDRVEGAILLAGMIAYTIAVLLLTRRERNENASSARHSRGRQPGAGGVVLRLGMILGGLVMLVVGADWIVAGAIPLAGILGVSELVVGLTVVALGTSLPEVATAVLAALRRQHDLAVGSVLGSNVCNILLVLGATSLFMPGGIVVPASVRNFDIPVMTAVAVICLPIFFTGLRIARWEGLLLLGYYAAYVAYLLLWASDHARLEMFSNVMLGVVLPITVITLVVLTIRGMRARHSERARA